jgi:hypothetical protein
MNERRLQLISLLILAGMKRAHFQQEQIQRALMCLIVR